MKDLLELQFIIIKIPMSIKLEHFEYVNDNQIRIPVLKWILKTI